MGTGFQKSTPLRRIISGAGIEPITLAADAEAIVAEHSAVRRSNELGVAYFVQSLRTGLPLLLVDLIVTTFALVMVTAIINGYYDRGFNPGTWRQLPVLLVLQTGLLSLHQLYPAIGTSAVEELRGVLRSTTIAFVCLSGMNLAFGELPQLELSVFSVSALVIFFLLPISRGLLRRVLAKTRWWGIRTLLVGNASDSHQVKQSIHQHRRLGVIVLDPLSRKPTTESASVQRSLEEIVGQAVRLRTPIAAVASTDLPCERLMYLFPCLLWMTPDQVSHPILSCPERRTMPQQRLIPQFTKRALDIFAACVGLIIFAVPMAIIALRIRMISPGPILHASLRIGRHGKPFKMWKFRTMIQDADDVLARLLAEDPEVRCEWERTAKLRADPRVIPKIGSFLRRASLDELPQFWNVLIGEMSLVGPRPVPAEEIVRYQDNYFEYTNMWPGLTGLWQISGRNDTSFDERVLFVRSYAENWSLWLDLWILMKTPLVVFLRRGAY